MMAHLPSSIFFLFLIIVQGTLCKNVFETVFEWKILDFAYPNEQSREDALISRSFIPENNPPLGLELWNDKLFITVPRWRQGVPSTLNYVPLRRNGPKSPALIPYPSWKHNEAGNCESGLMNVYRIKVDKCDRLWALDTGTFGIGSTTKNQCPYALNVFDLKTNTRLRRYVLPQKDIRPSTFIANIAVDIGKSCRDTFAYMSDEKSYALIVYSWDENRSWRFEHSYFWPDPLAADFNIAGLNFQWGDNGIFGMSLTPLQRDGFRTLHFSALASNREFAVSTRILRNESRVEESYHDFVALEDRGPNSHTTGRDMDEMGVQFFNLIDRNGVGCWNSKLPYTPTNLAVVDRDDKEMIFPSDIKVGPKRTVWVLSDRLNVFLLSNLNYNDVNFRVMYAPAEKLIEGTVCKDDDFPKSNFEQQMLPDHTSFDFLSNTDKPSSNSFGQTSMDSKIYDSFPTESPILNRFSGEIDDSKTSTFGQPSPVTFLEQLTTRLPSYLRQTSRWDYNDGSIKRVQHNNDHWHDSHSRNNGNKIARPSPYGSYFG